MGKFNYEKLANYLLDNLLEFYSPNEMIKMLLNGNVEIDFLLELGFDQSDIELVNTQIKLEINEDTKND